MKHVPHGREQERKQPGVGTQGPIKKPTRDPDPRTLEKEHGQQLAEEVSLRVPERPSVTKQQEKEACAEVPEGVPQSESRELLPKVQEGRGRMHARLNPEVPAEQQWDSEEQGPEHNGAYFEQVTCLR